MASSIMTAATLKSWRRVEAAPDARHVWELAIRQFWTDSTYSESSSRLRVADLRRQTERLAGCDKLDEGTFYNPFGVFCITQR